MTSEAKIAANRRNAWRSTGPKTERGKERARLNALRYGMTAKQLVATNEDFGDFARFGAEMRATLAPADAVEEQLVDGIVVASWRLRRTWRTEAAMIQLAARRVDTWDKADVAAVPISRVAQELERISRYESALERLIQRGYAALERRQARRAAQASASTQNPELQNEPKLG